MKTKNVNKSQDQTASKKQNKLISLGGLHLMLTLTLPDDYFDSREVKYDQLSSLKDLSFLNEDKELWNNIMLTSNNDGINLLMQANVPFAKKVPVDLVVMNKISYTEEQQQFQESLLNVLKANSIQVIESEVCNCNIAIILYVKWKDQVKSFSLCNETHFASKEEKEEEEMKKEKEEEEKKKQTVKEKEKEKENCNDSNIDNELRGESNENEKKEEDKQCNEQSGDLQKKKTVNDQNNKDPNSSELEKKKTVNDPTGDDLQKQKTINEKLKESNSNSDLQKKKTGNEKNEPEFLRNDSKTVEAKPPQQETNPKQPKAQAPPGDEQSQQQQKEQPSQEQQQTNEAKPEDANKQQSEDDNPLSKISAQCDSYEYLLINLCDYTKGEIGTSITLKHLLSYFLDLKVNSNAKIILNTINSLPPSMTNEDLQTLEYILQTVDFIFGDKKETIHLYQAIHDFHKDQTKFEKKQYLTVFYNHIASKSLSKSKHKIVVYIDEFNKMHIAESNGSKKQHISELDATLYPKINHYNHKTIEEYKNLILDNYLTYSILFVGAFVGKLIQGTIDSKTIYCAYLTAIESVKKILELNKNGLEKPRDPSFYIVKLPQGKINEKMGNDLLQSKEKSFVLDCVNEKKSKLKYYNPLFDSHLNSFFSCETNRKELKTKGFINTKGFIMYDSAYRDLLGGSKQKRRGEKADEHMLIKTINSINVGEYYPNKEVNAQEQVMRQTSPLPKKLPKVQNNYTQYQKMNNTRRLPPLRTSGNFNNSSCSNNNTKDNQGQKTGNVCKTEASEKFERKNNMGDSEVQA